MASIGNQDKFLRFHPAGHVVACPACKDHGVNVLEDGSRRCVMTGETFEATEKDGDLFAIRSNYEREILNLAIRSGHDWSFIVEMAQPERQALATSFELIDQYQKNRGANPAALTVAVIPLENRDHQIVENAVAYLVEQGWEVSPARADSACDQRTLWLKRPSSIA